MSARRSIRAEAIRYADQGVRNNPDLSWTDLFYARYRQLVQRRIHHTRRTRTR
jgi:hypothetical protein